MRSEVAASLCFRRETKERERDEREKKSHLQSVKVPKVLPEESARINTPNSLFLRPYLYSLLSGQTSTFYLLCEEIQENTAKSELSVKICSFITGTPLDQSSTCNIPQNWITVLCMQGVQRGGGGGVGLKCLQIKGAPQQQKMRKSTLHGHKCGCMREEKNQTKKKKTKCPPAATVQHHRHA